METKTIMSWVIVVVVIVLGAFLLMRGSNSTQEDTEETGVTDEMVLDENRMEDGVIEGNMISDKEIDEINMVVVTYTDEGFSPKELTVNKGDTVKFINNSTGRMWVGSAIHPTHSNYPIKSDSDCLGSSFDQCVASAKGTSWEFQFDATGTHGYHNHVRASHFGKVIVK